MTAFRFENHPFWDFSLRVYGSDGVPAACIALQERRGIDVNLLLFSAWIGESGRGVLAESDLDATLAATTLAGAAVADRLNLEVDVLGKYVRRYLQSLAGGAGGLSLEKLRDAGFA